jgi:hypothetical protein
VEILGRAEPDISTRPQAGRKLEEGAVVTAAPRWERASNHRQTRYQEVRGSTMTVTSRG